MLDMWAGENGVYEVPRAISHLGRLANRRLGMPASCGGYLEFRRWMSSPYYKIVEEWGLWRDKVSQDDTKTVEVPENRP